jgi:hypothetical protein
MIGSDEALQVGSNGHIEGTMIIDSGPRSTPIYFFAVLSIAFTLSVIGSFGSAVGLVFELMDASDAGLTVGGGTTGLVFAAPVLILALAISTIISFVLWRTALRPSPRTPGRLRKSLRVIGLILLAAGGALTLVVILLQIAIDAHEHAVARVSLRAFEIFCSIGFAAAFVGTFSLMTRTRR